MAIPVIGGGYRPNAFDKAGDIGSKALQQVLTGQITQAQAAEIVCTTQANVSKIITNIKNYLSSDITLSGSMPITRYAQQLELDNVKNKIKQVADGHWEVNPLAVLHHNIIRVDRMIMEIIKDPPLAVGMMIQQSKMAEMLTKLQPPEEITLDINQLYSHADAVIKFIPLLAAELDELGDEHGFTYDLKKRFVEYIQDVKGKDYVFDD